MRVVVKEIAGQEAAAEIAALRVASRRGLAPRLIAAEPAANGTRVSVVHRGRDFPRCAEASDVVSFARALAELHRVRPPAAVRRRPGGLVPPSIGEGSRILTVTLGRLARDARFTWTQRRAFSAWRQAALATGRLLRVLDDEWRAPAVVLCHGDIKAENLRRDGTRALLIDFGSVCLAEPAWELAHAALALELSPRLQDLLLREYAAERRGLARLGARMQGWQLILGAAVPLEWMEGGQPASARVRARLARLLERARVDLSLIVGRKLPSLAAAFRRVETAQRGSRRRRNPVRATRRGSRRRSGRP